LSLSGYLADFKISCQRQHWQVATVTYSDRVVLYMYTSRQSSWARNWRAARQARPQQGNAEERAYSPNVRSKPLVTN